MIDLAKIKSLREKLGLTQDDAAMRAGFASRQRWNDIESGRKASVTVNTLEQIAKALGVKGKDLLK
jgi:transcriptional regulator with XRE-family HTH domain